MLKIWLEDGLSLRNKTGIGNYVLMLNKLLTELNIDLIMPKKHSLIKIKSSIIRRFFYFLWLNLVLPFELYFSKCNVLWCASIMTPLIKLPGIRYISTIHDIESFIYPEFMDKIKKIYADLSVMSAVKNADFIVTVSETIKDEILNKFDYKKENISTIYNTSSLEPPASIVAGVDKIINKYELKPNYYIISVSTLNKRKNLKSLIAAFELISIKYPDLKLILVGAKGNNKFYINNEKIIFTEYIKDEEIPILYHNALMSIFPSLYEGFGIPIIESQMSEVPLICSNIPVFREVAGEGAIFCEPNASGIASKIELLINDNKLQKELIKKGLINIERFGHDIINSQVKEILDRLAC